MTEFIKNHPLNAKHTGGAVGVPTIGTMDEFTTAASADTRNSDTDLNQSYSAENKSAQFKYPRQSQDIPEKGRNQYEKRETDEA